MTIDGHARLSPTMVLLLSLVVAGTQRDDGRVVRWWTPRVDAERVTLPDGEELEYRVWGASDANALRAVERRGLIRRMSHGGYGFAATEAGHTWIEDERARHAAKRGS